MGPEAESRRAGRELEVKPGLAEIWDLLENVTKARDSPAAINSSCSIRRQPSGGQVTLVSLSFPRGGKPRAPGNYPTRQA
jgi:hypothetical protein